MPVLRITNKVISHPLSQPMHYLAYGNYGNDQNTSLPNNSKAKQTFNTPHVNNHQVTERNYNLLSTDGIVNWNPKMNKEIGLAQLEKLNRVYDRYMAVAPAYHVKAFNLVINFGHDFDFKASPEDRYEGMTIVRKFLNQNFKNFPALLASQDDSTNKQSHVHILLINYNPVTHKSLSNQQRNAWRLGQSLQNIARVHNQLYPWRKVSVLKFAGHDKRTKPTIVEQSAIRHFKPVLDDIKKKHFTDFSQVRADGLKHSIIIDKHNKGDIRLNRNFKKLKNKREAFYTRDGMSLKVPTIHSSDPELNNDNTRGFVSLSKITPFVTGASTKDIEHDLHVNYQKANVIGSATAKLEQASEAGVSAKATINHQAQLSRNSYLASSAFASNMSADASSNSKVDSMEDSKAVDRVKLVYKAIQHNHEMHVSHQAVTTMIKPLQRSSALNKIKQAKAKRLANLAMNRLIIKRAINQLHNNVHAGQQFQAHHNQFITVKNSLVNKQITNSLKPIKAFGSSAKTFRAKRNSLISASIATSQAEDMGMKLVPQSLANENFSKHSAKYSVVHKADLAKIAEQKQQQKQAQLQRDLAQMHQLNVIREKHTKASEAKEKKSVEADLSSRDFFISSVANVYHSVETPEIEQATKIVQSQEQANHSLNKAEKEAIKNSVETSQNAQASSEANVRDYASKVNTSLSAEQSTEASQSASSAIDAENKSMSASVNSEMSLSAFHSKMSSKIYSAGFSGASENVEFNLIHTSNSAEYDRVYHEGLHSGEVDEIKSLALEHGGVKKVAPNYYSRSVASSKAEESNKNKYIVSPNSISSAASYANAHVDQISAEIRNYLNRNGRGFDR